ncbi:asparagine synthetase B family protein [Alkalihalobacterium chitinilyticum]|uniref:asparagine synthase (glutamine-hydrolyzing) n=1 Tax=Alkalihalobacterium chitinilyticum TaxID=2980103 RepID=A0ABT5VIX5_9BACI|nr:asparagine synthetase B [Alkalihalobacterium chitinilyticum]MDE5415406.1 asparagine synthetase B [Alkalihalobacterium chitinilyticum]
MCGIIGIFSREKASLDDIFTIIKKLKKRGPDGLGLLQNNSYSIGGTRLSITGPQTIPVPLINNLSNWGIVYNGEIYNLQPNSDVTDTEILLECLEQNPLSNHFDGMFAYCFFNLNNGFAYINRDYFGIKPLYYLKGDKEFRFCSEVFGLNQNDKKISISPQLLFEYLSIGMSLDNNTMFNDIYSFPTDKILKIQQEEKIINYSFINKTPKTEEINNGNSLLDSLRDAVLECANTKKPLGLFLSGGIDSTAIAFILAKNEVKDIKTFSLLLGEDGVESLNDLNLPGESWKTWEHYTLRPSNDDINNAFTMVLNITSEPCFPMSSIYTYLLSEMASKEKIKVVLSGEGADELFLGYQSYLDFIEKQDSNFVNFYLNKQSTVLVENMIESAHSTKKITEQKLNDFAENETGLINQLLAAERIVSLRPLLNRIDNTSMFHSIEIRVPFLHGDVPTKAKILMSNISIGDIKGTKPLLRAELKPILSDRLVNTPKRPLRLNLKEYFLHNKLEDLFESLNIKEIQSYLPLNEKELKSFLENLKRNAPTEEALIVAIRLYQICYFIRRTGVTDEQKVLEKV